MKKALMLAISVLFGALLIGCQSNSSQQGVQLQTISGSVAYRERIALPEHAVVTVKLQDVSLADAPAKVIAEQTIQTNGAQVPFDFKLMYDASSIIPNHTYSVSARIEVDGKLRFITDTINPAITDANNTTQFNLMLVGVR
ncbi:YbaY family lipoprotein [Vibrio sp. LaRot3]|uniref:YbaY family lipoprotein n=1 Tax=Vibrio sp. LaRot3 TaxID=2998829 RepID=UPI0022CE18AA|nr:YbaY family lipoprotein [Vibrio sp. LaRot3]MDA0147896.1 YbaY family lipoprotein [Vibrio sp. LaRot3]